MRFRPRVVAAQVCVFTLVWLGSMATHAQAPAGGAPSLAASTMFQEMLLSVQLNGVDTGDTALLLLAADGGSLVRAADLQRWRLNLPASTALMHDGEAFYRLDDLPGLSYQVIASRQSLVLTADPALFIATSLDLMAIEAASPPPAPLGAFLNYDVFAALAGTQQQIGALLELGAFNRLGSGVGTFAVRNGSTAGPHVLRLETAWTRDLPERRVSLRLGDAISGASQWGLPVRFGGLQWARNFTTQPGFVTFPLPSMAGQAALPSTIDLYINDVLQLRRDVPAGPFSLQQLPVVTGQGEARLVVRDVLGREEVITVSYHATPRLLRPGLHDFSYEAGLIREDFGLVSNHYGRAAAVATHRLGLSDRLTVEAHGEWLASQQTAGLGAVLWWPELPTFNAALALSHSQRGVGQLLALGADYQSGRIGWGFNTQFTSTNFMQMGQEPDRPAVRRNLQTFASYGTGRGSFLLSYSAQAPRDRDAVRLLNVGYNVSLGKIGFLGVSLVRIAGPQSKVVANLTFTRALGARTTVSTGANAQSGNIQAQVQWQRDPPVGTGTGYRVTATTGTNARVDASANLQHPAGTAGLDLSVSPNQQGVRLGATGGLALLEGHMYTSRRIDNSFALVQVPGQAGVGIYTDNQLVARTRSDGTALVPRLRPYQKNSVRIEQADISLDAQIDSLQIDAVPAFRSGMVLRFPVRHLRSAVLTVTLAGGRPVPAGALAQIVGQSEDFPFGFEGQLYLTGLEASNDVIVRWRDRQCQFTFALPDSSDPIPDLGVHSCEAVTP